MNLEHEKDIERLRKAALLLEAENRRLSAAVVEQVLKLDEADRVCNSCGGELQAWDYGSRSRRGTEVAALFYSLLESAKLCRLEPKAYLPYTPRFAVSTSRCRTRLRRSAAQPVAA